MTAYELAQAEIGTVEWSKGANPKVMAYFKDAGHTEVSDDSISWCAAFVGAMIKRAGQTPTGSLLARSYLKWGNPVDLKDARPGDIAVFSRGNSTWQGHVAFFVKENASTLSILGGNQSDKVSVSTYPKASLLSIRRAPGVIKSLPPKQPATAPQPAQEPTTAETPQSLWAWLFSAVLGMFKPKGPN